MLITVTDRKRFDGIRKDLDVLGSSEGSFLKVQLLFYEALNMAKAYGGNVDVNSLLAALRTIQNGAYEKTNEICRTRAQKERLIHQFIVQFKKAINSKRMLIS